MSRGSEHTPGTVIMTFLTLHIAASATISCHASLHDCHLLTVRIEREDDFHRSLLRDDSNAAFVVAPHHLHCGLGRKPFHCHALRANVCHVAGPFHTHALRLDVLSTLAHSSTVDPAAADGAELTLRA